MAEKETKQEWVIVGLGNPGKKYQRTRHNIGAAAVEETTRRRGWTLKEETRWPARVATGHMKQALVHLVLPATYMNESGIAVQRYLRYFKIPRRRMLVVSDDVDLRFGELRLRPKGSSGGHNGHKSVMTHVGSNDYPRLRLGIGRQANAQQRLSEYVLEPFSAEEMQKLDLFLTAAAEVLQAIPKEGLEPVMKRVNTVAAKNGKKPDVSSAGENE